MKKLFLISTILVLQLLSLRAATVTNDLMTRAEVMAAINSSGGREWMFMGDSLYSSKYTFNPNTGNTEYQRSFIGNLSTNVLYNTVFQDGDSSLFLPIPDSVSSQVRVTIVATKQYTTNTATGNVVFSTLAGGVTTNAYNVVNVNSVYPADTDITYTYDNAGVPQYTTNSFSAGGTCTGVFVSTNTFIGMATSNFKFVKVNLNLTKTVSTLTNQVAIYLIKIKEI